MPQYKKAFDIGTYTGNGGQYRVGMPTLRVVGPTGTQVAGSLRFRQENSAYLYRTSGTPTNQQKMTFSFWLKKTSASATRNILFTNDSGGAYGYFEIYSDNSLTCGDYGSGGYSSTFKFVDTSRWYHLVIAFDTTQASATNRMIVYVDGVRDGGSYAGLTQNGNLYLNASGYTSQIGSFTRIGVYSGIYLSQFYLIDGQQLTPSSFGEINSDGIWVPKAYSGTYGNNGCYLPMNNSNNFKNDQSGNGNNWTPSVFNVTTSNTTYDLVTDSPTDYLSGSMSTANNAGNYCVINRNDTYATAGSWSVTNGGLYLTSSATLGSVRGTIGFSSGKWYWEVKYINGNSSEIAGISTITSTSAGGSSGGIGYYTNGNIYINGSATAYGTAVSAGDIIGIAVDMDNGKIWFSKNGTWQNSGDPAAGTNPGTTGLSGTYYPGFEDAASGTNATFEANFGQRTFTYTPPTGFKALNTYNYSRPADSSMWFYGDTPDLVWIKNRSTTGWHILTDTVRGQGLQLSTNSSNADSGGPGVIELNKFGMTILNEGTFLGNGSGNSHVYWAWKAGSNTSSTSVTNTDGTITSQVSANRQFGFSIVAWTGTGATSASVGHGLGTGTPNFVIIKKRNVSEGWYVCHSSSGQGLNYAYHLFLNTTGALVGSNDPYLLGSQSNDNKLYLADGVSNNGGNQSGTNYIAYCWTAIPGYSAFGSYTGNSSTDGPFVYLGFRPRFIMLKNTSNIAGPSNWVIIDAVRNTYNVSGSVINPNTTGAESASYGTCMDILSNGFKIRIGADGNFNYTGDTLVYAAFAEIPFRFARAR
jgi:Concanavalin A-like lectin/glucanases superfamily/SPRY domain